MSINYVSVAAAAAASWVFGAVYYGALGKRWMAALGKTKAEIETQHGKKSPPLFALILSFAAEALMAAVLYGLIFHIAGGPNIRPSLVTAGFAWVGFVVTVLATNHAYQQAKPSLTLIDSGHWLGVLLIQGLVIGAIG